MLSEVASREGVAVTACGSGELGHLGSYISYFGGEGVGRSESSKRYLPEAVVKSFTFKFLAIFVECNLDCIYK